MSIPIRATLGVVVAALAVACDSAPPLPATVPDTPYDVLVFSPAPGPIQELGASNGFTVTTAGDTVSAGELARYEAVVFLDTTAGRLDASTRGAVEAYVRGGGGHVGVRTAAGDWPFYAELADPAGARVLAEDAGVPRTWCRTVQNGRSVVIAGDAEPALLDGIRYAANRTRADCRPETGYVPLYDGSTTGWSQAGPGSFTNSGATLTSTGGMGLFWYAAREFRSYSLKLDWRVAGDDNSGVFVGFPPSPDPNSAVRGGYEVQIDATDAADKTTGALYGFASADLPARDAALNPPGEWNTFEILVEGERLRVFLNGVLINDFTNADSARSLTSGYVGIQNHGAGDEVAFRHIRIKELSGVGP